MKKILIWFCIRIRHSEDSKNLFQGFWSSPSPNYFSGVTTGFLCPINTSIECFQLLVRYLIQKLFFVEFCFPNFSPNEGKSTAIFTFLDVQTQIPLYLRAWLFSLKPQGKAESGAGHFVENQNHWPCFLCLHLMHKMSDFCDIFHPNLVNQSLFFQ